MQVRGSYYSTEYHKSQSKKSKQKKLKGHFGPKGGQNRRGRFNKTNPSTIFSGNASRHPRSYKKSLAIKPAVRFNVTYHYLMRKPIPRLLKFKYKRNLYNSFSAGLRATPANYLRSLLGSYSLTGEVKSRFKYRLKTRRALNNASTFLQTVSSVEAGGGRGGKYYPKLVFPELLARPNSLAQLSYLSLLSTAALNISTIKGFELYPNSLLQQFSRGIGSDRVWNYLYSAVAEGTAVTYKPSNLRPFNSTRKTTRRSAWRTTLLQAILFRARYRLRGILGARAQRILPTDTSSRILQRHYRLVMFRSSKSRSRRWNAARTGKSIVRALGRLDRLRYRAILPFPKIPVRHEFKTFNQRRLGQRLTSMLATSTILPSSGFLAFLPKKKRRKKINRDQKNKVERTSPEPYFQPPSPDYPVFYQHREEYQKPRDIRKEFQAFVKRSPGRLVIREGQWVLRIKRRGGRIDYRPLKLQDLRPDSVWKTRVGGGKKKWVYKSIRRNRLWNYLTRTRTPYDNVMLRARDYRRVKRIFGYLQWKYNYTRSLHRKRAVSCRASKSHSSPTNQLSFYAILKDPQNNFTIIQNRGRSSLLNYLTMTITNKRFGRGLIISPSSRWRSRRIGAWSLNRIYFINDTIGVAPRTHRAVGSAFVRPNRITHFVGSDIRPFKPYASVVDPVNFEDGPKLKNHPSTPIITQLGVYHSLSSRFKSPYLASLMKPRFREILTIKQVQYGKTR